MTELELEDFELNTGDDDDESNEFCYNLLSDEVRTTDMLLHRNKPQPQPQQQDQPTEQTLSTIPDAIDNEVAHLLCNERSIDHIPKKQKRDHHNHHQQQLEKKSSNTSMMYTRIQFIMLMDEFFETL